jgi:hypothetical protein
MALVVERLRHLVAVLARLRVPVPEGKVEDLGKDGEARRPPARRAESSETSDVDWFCKGWTVYKGSVRDAAYFAPLNDMEAQRWWLGGFGAAWAEDLDDDVVESVLQGDGMDGESVEEPLARALVGREDLLRQLRSHRAGWAVRTVQ